MPANRYGVNFVDPTLKDYGTRRLLVINKNFTQSLPCKEDTAFNGA